MCGRYYIEKDDSGEELGRIIQRLNRTDGVRTEGEIRPSETAPVIASSRRLEPGVFAMRWGFTGGDTLLFNARSETADQKPMFRDSLRSRRCVIPASGYYEWEKRGCVRVKYAIRSAEAETTYLAGLYRLTDAGAEFTVLTAAPAESIAFIHDRMPLILPSTLIRDWINPKNDARELMACAVKDVRFEKQEPGNNGSLLTGLIE